MRRFQNYHFIEHYYKLLTKKPREIKSIYDGLKKSTLYRWFTTSRVLKKKYKYFVEDEKGFIKPNQHAPILSKYLK
jgi:hypothetical protein